MMIGSGSPDPPRVPRRWSLQVLSRLRLTDAVGAEIAIPGNHDPALLVYLVLNQGRRLPRIKLASLLWAARADPPHSLSESLKKLRKALGDTEGRVIALNSDPVATDFSGMEVDALSFEQLAAQGKREALEQAEALFAGELLEGFDSRSDEFEQWLAAERSRLRDLLVGVLSRLLHFRAEAGQIEKAIETAQRLLGLDDLHEETYLLLMRLYQRSGHRRAALKTADLCEETLRRENIAPEPETRRVIAELRGAAPSDGPPPEQPKPNGQREAASGQAPPQPQASRRLKTHLRRWVIGGTALAALVTSLVIGKDVWRYWAIPWAAPYPASYALAWAKKLAPGDAPLRIAVLRFGRNDPKVEARADTLSEGITSALGTVSEMFVISAYSVQPYGPVPPDLRHVARDLGVGYLLLGSVHQSGDQDRVQVRLIDGNDGSQVWGKSYSGQTGMLDLESKITFDVITEVQVQLTEGEKERITAIHGTENFDAWLATGEALKLLRHLTPQDNARARQLYEEAIALDSSYAGAYEGLAWTHLLDAEFGWSQSINQSVAEAQRLTQQAFEIDPEKARLYSLRGHLNLLQLNFEQAVDDGERAVEAERNDADAAALLAFTLTYTGEPNRAIALMRRAIELSPRYPAWYGWALGRAYRLAGDPNRAVATLEANLPERPNSVIPLVELVIAYVEAERPAKVMGAMIRERVPHFTIGAWTALQPYEDPAATERDAAALRAAGLPE